MIQLMKKRLDPDSMEILYDRPFTPESVAEDFTVRGGKWQVDEDGWLIGENRENSAAMIMSKAEYFGDVLVEFDASTVLPATRDINVTWHGSWDEENDRRGWAYVAGIQGWWQGMVGFEKSPNYDLFVTTKLFPFEPGRTYHVTVGNIANDIFVAIDGVVALEIHDPDPIDIMKYGQIGFEAYCTKVRYRDVKVRRVTYVDTAAPYEPEF